MTSGTVALSQVPTPYVEVDVPRLHANVRRAQDAASACGAALRPHFKTHRSTQVAELQLAAGAIGMTCATLAQLLAIDQLPGEVLLSSAVHLDAAVHPHLRALDGPVLHSLSSEASAGALREALGPEAEARALLEIDVGCDRGGLDPDECHRLARFARDLGLEVRGVLGYPGQAYAPDSQEAAAASERSLLEAAAADLTRHGFEVEYLSAGSSPTMRYVGTGPATEYRPGTYVFGDAQQVALGSSSLDDVSLTVVATVVAQRDGQVILNAGGKSIGRDRPPWLPSGGFLPEHDAHIARVYDHHAVIEQLDGRPSLELGSRVRVVPNNANSVISLQGRFWLANGNDRGTPVDVIDDVRPPVTDPRAGRRGGTGGSR